jgi:tRNA A-37 threonylcarbamoyl transferase component Bud32
LSGKKGAYEDYEIDDLVDAIIASREPIAPLPDSAIEAIEPANGRQLNLDGLEGSDDFDVDSIVNAIVSASKTTRDLAPRKSSAIDTPPPKVQQADPPPRILHPEPPSQPGPRSSSQVRPWAETTPGPQAQAGTPWAELTPSQLPPQTGSPFADQSPTPTPPLGVPLVSVPSFEPPRRPPPRSESRSHVPPGPSPFDHATPPEPIDMSRAEQPTRPPGGPMQITQPGKGEEPEPEIPAGTIIGDRYRVVDLIGRGGVSVVYRVEHTLLLKRMALKVLRPELSQTPSVVDRFHREARLVCQLDDPHIVRVTDFGRTGDGSLYLVMDYVDGESLAAKLRREGKVSPEPAVKIVLEVLAGLAHAHESGVVHRDLKPENIMVQERNYRLNTKILDFGIAKLGDGDGAKSITQVGTVFGTPRYMSPEQAAGEIVDRRTDVYSSGVILYELLTGRPPFDGETTVRILSKVLTQEAPPLDLASPAPYKLEALQGIVDKALAKEKSDRYATVQEFRDALETCERA